MTPRAKIAVLRSLALLGSVPMLLLCVAVSPLFIGPYFAFGILLNEVARRTRCNSCGGLIFTRRQPIVGSIPRRCPKCGGAL
jgi:hypothetical protein